MSTNNWLHFALDDLDGARILLRENKFNMVCFHAQQAAEKALKGYLIHNKVSSPRTHNLIELVNLCKKIDSSFSNFMVQMATLNQFYAPTRYPDAVVGISPKGMPSKDLSQKAFDYAHEIVIFCREKINA